MSPKRPSSSIRSARATRAAVVLLFVCAAVVLLTVAVRGHRDTQVRLGGRLVPQEGSPERYLSAEAQRWADTRVLLRVGHHVWRPTRRELGAGLPVREAVERLHALDHSSNPLVMIREWTSGYFGKVVDLPWRARIEDERALDVYVQNLQAAVSRPPVVGSFDPDNQPIAGLPGETVDVEVTRRAIQRAMALGDVELQVPTVVTPPPRLFRRFVQAEAPADVDTHVLMMRQETSYRAGSKGRATNIELAARKLDGSVLMPGAALSFNERVGRRDASRGFAPALELVNGEVTLGVGGGVCQVAGTLHAAAFFAGLEVEEYRPHSRLNQFAYLRPGLDTMVAWPAHVQTLSGTKDMRVRNPYPFPIVVRTTVLAEGEGTMKLRVELYGSEKPFRVEFSFEELERVPASEIRRPDDALRAGQEELQQDAEPGLVILRRRTIYRPDRRIDEETRVSYPPTPRILRVSRG